MCLKCAMQEIHEEQVKLAEKLLAPVLEVAMEALEESSRTGIPLSPERDAELAKQVMAATAAYDEESFKIAQAVLIRTAAHQQGTMSN